MFWTAAVVYLSVQVAGLLLKEYRDSFRGSPVAATFAYLKVWALDNLPPNPLVTHETGEQYQQ